MLDIRTLKSRQFPFALLQTSVVVLPYFSYLGMAGFLGLLVVTLRRRGWKMLQPRLVQMLGAIALGLIINAIYAFHPPEAFLQLANFIPYFLLFAVLIQVITEVEQLFSLALSLVLTSIPMNLAAIAEYWLKAPVIKASLGNVSLLGWFYRQDYGHRANSFFGHPNSYVCYLIILLGLGLGLLLLSAQSAVTPFPAVRRGARPDFAIPRTLLYIALIFIGIGIFCAGSRNGFLVALCQLILLMILGRRQRFLLFSGFSAIALLIISAIVGGIGERQVTLQGIMTGIQQDPRLSVWKIAVDLTLERPWLGWGLGNYKFLYPPRSTHPLYPHVFHPHNFWLLMASEAGLILTLAFSLIVGYLCYRALRLYLRCTLDINSQMLLVGYQLAAWGFILFSVFDLPFYDVRINVLSWLSLAGLYGFTHQVPSKVAMFDEQLQEVPW